METDIKGADVMENSRFYYCKHCKNLVGMIQNSGVPIYCCGEKMVNLEPNEQEGTEKHKPVVKVDGNTVFVSIGKISHPMEEDHYIEWVYLQTDIGGHRRALVCGSAPEAVFKLTDETPVCVYVYCNKHGLYRTTI